jgi:galactitol-specific phosphotransferase system IIB component
MSYNINKTDGNLLVTIQDGTTNTDTGLVLIGRNYTGYGQIQNDNFVRLLENFADRVPPGQSVGFAPIAGTLWWDTGNQLLKIYNGQSFIPVSQRTAANTAPVIHNVGDQWWDTTNNQLNVWAGSSWLVIGPVASSGQGKTGVFVENLSGSAQPLVNTYVSGNVVSVYNTTAPFLVANSSFAAFDTINTGFNVGTQLTVSGNLDVTGTSTLNDDTTINGQLYLNWANGPGAAMLPGQTRVYDLGAPGAVFRDVYAQGNLVLSGANIGARGAALVLQNTQRSGNIDVYVNSATGNVRALYVNGNTGRVGITQIPSDALDIANKAFVDAEVQSVVQEIFNTSSQVQANVEQVIADYRANISYVVNSTNSNLTSVTNTLTANLITLSQATASGFASVNAVTNNLQNQITPIASTISTLATIASPTFTGTPVAPTAPLNTNNRQISTTEYVDREAAILSADYNSKIQSLNSAINGDIAARLALLAPKASPVLTGNPVAPTPAAGNNSATIATTAFVEGEIASVRSTWQGSKYTVSTQPPSGGNPGDFWFQIG